MLSNPVTLVAEPFCLLDEVERVPKRLSDRGAGRNRSEIEHRQRRWPDGQHAGEYRSRALPGRARRLVEWLGESSGCLLDEGDLGGQATTRQRAGRVRRRSIRWS